MPCRESLSLSRATSGLLLQPDIPRPQRLGVKRSTAVLVGRLLMAGLLMVAGYKQVGWVQQHRAYTPGAPHAASMSACSFAGAEAVSCRTVT